MPALAWFLSPGGIVLLGLLDATVVFWIGSDGLARAERVQSRA